MKIDYRIIEKELCNYSKQELIDEIIKSIKIFDYLLENEFTVNGRKYNIQQIIKGKRLDILFNELNLDIEEIIDENKNLTNNNIDLEQELYDIKQFNSM